MGRHNRQASQVRTLQTQHRRNQELSQALHRSIFSHLARPVADPDRPGEWISYDELDQRLRGRAYRQATLAARQRSRH